MQGKRLQVTLAEAKTGSEIVLASENHTCDKFIRGIREVFLSFPGGF